MINIQINSKYINPGDTFVAIKGKNVDGHNFVEEAIKNGAAKVIVSNNKKYSVETINTDDTNKYLINYLIKTYAKDFNKLKIVGITGTNGKTTTAYMTYQKLRQLNINAAYIGTIGFYYNGTEEKTLNTTPDILTTYKYIERAKEYNCKIIILEASSIGLVEDRLGGIKFDTAVFTNLTHDHLDYHLNMHSYMLAKKVLFDNLKENGTSIVNIDDKYYPNFVTKKNITYGFGEADLRCIKHDSAFSEFKFNYNNNIYDIKSQLYGKYNIHNILAVISILLSLNINIDDICRDFDLLKAPKGRLNIINYKNNKIIVDYAHTPDGLKQVLSSTKILTKGKLYVVFGCPGDRDRKKRPMMSRIVNEYADYFVITNDDPHNEDENRIVRDATKKLVSNKFNVILDRKEAIKTAFNKLNENDCLLILGKGHEEVIIIKDKRIPHNDTKYVESLINEA